MDNKLAKLNLLGQYLTASRSEEEVLEMAMLISRDVLGYDHAILRLLEGETLLSKKWIGFPREAADLAIRVGEGITGEAARSGETIIVDDTTADPRFLSGVENCRSELCVPMRYNDRVIGVINVESDEQAFFSAVDARLLETLASQIAAAMETLRLKEELLRAEKLAVVGNMASSILHDIRNDIHQLHISADLLERGGSEERMTMIAGLVRRAGDNIYSLIEDIFEFVKTGQSPLQRKPTTIEDLLAPVIDFATSLSKDAVTVAVSGGRDTIVAVDARRFRRALVNLARNAVEAMPEGGTLAFVIREGEEGKLCLDVTDTGVGIEEDKLHKIWEPLFTYGKQYGTGLGMAIVKKIVEDHGFAIDVTSEPGRGTSFSVVMDTLDRQAP
jgi:K+-sensing histidine kinase KdpD